MFDLPKIMQDGEYDYAGWHKGYLLLANDMITAQELSHTQFRIMVFLLSFKFLEKKYNTSRKAISKNLGMSEHTVIKDIEYLLEKGYVTSRKVGKYYTVFSVNVHTEVTASTEKDVPRTAKVQRQDCKSAALRLQKCSTQELRNKGIKEEEGACALTPPITQSPIGIPEQPRISLKVPSEEVATPEWLKETINTVYAPKIGRGRCQYLGGTRLKLVKDALKALPLKAEWTPALDVLFAQDWVNDRKFPFSFDSIFEKSRYLKAYEKSKESAPNEGNNKGQGLFKTLDSLFHS